MLQTYFGLAYVSFAKILQSKLLHQASLTYNGSEQCIQLYFLNAYPEINSALIDSLYSEIGDLKNTKISQHFVN